MSEPLNVIIIGSGPAGLTAAGSGWMAAIDAERFLESVSDVHDHASATARDVLSARRYATARPAR